jgi:hypothetical protein
VTTPAPVTRYCCPLPDCGWEHDVTPADGPLAVEMVLRLHVDDHSPLEYLRALLAGQDRERKLTVELARWRPRRAVTHHTYEGPGPCRADLCGQTCDYPRDDHELVSDRPS